MAVAYRTDLGLLALRLGAGSVLFAHGTQKLFGWFGGGGLGAAAEGMEQMGFRPGRESALASGLAETGGGALLALGLATPAAGAAAAGGMAAAVSLHLPAGFFNASGGLEHPGLLGWTAASLGLAGPGRFSLDELTGHCLNRPWVLATAFTASAVGAAAVIRKRARFLAQQKASGG
ncbi:putative oxidoreductase [Streptomyces sp. DvalAA-14]|uniref:DoxX family membrane protein n=1 Tax=unclassified Streptomyces TaxID=2593676 RepID=UPI00081BA56B|nr:MULTISPECIES: DoxX family membrane protein [unclassified Streptomyces]MYS23052.1 DoxX family membrane protein [Streptomyces sp. SID4948]SCE26594.1 putative oxidoreductase [Streptomyces sp. DvalAA-14]